MPFGRSASDLPLTNQQQTACAVVLVSKIQKLHILYLKVINLLSILSKRGGSGKVTLQERSGEWGGTVCNPGKGA